MTIDISSLPKRRRDAIASGAEYYFTGKPCVRGHVAPLKAPGGACVECAPARYAEKRGGVENLPMVKRAARLAAVVPQPRRNTDIPNLWNCDGSPLPCDDVIVDDEVLCLDNEWRLSLRPVVRVVDEDCSSFIKISTAGRACVVPASAKILVNGEYAEASTIVIGDLVAVPRHIPVFGDEEMPEHELDLLAVWMAEGRNYGISNGTPEVLDVCRHAVKRLGDDMDFIQTGKYDWKIRNISGKRWKPSEPANKFRLFIEALDLWDKDSKTKFIPECVYRLPRHQLARFLNLFWACDGSISLKNADKKIYSIECGLANERLITEISELLWKFGIRGAINYKKHKALNRFGDPYESWNFITSNPDCLISFADNVNALAKENRAADAKASAISSRGNCNEYMPLSYDLFMQNAVYEPYYRDRVCYNTITPNDMPPDLKDLLNSWRKQTPSRMSRKRFDQMYQFIGEPIKKFGDADVCWEEVTDVRTTYEGPSLTPVVQNGYSVVCGGLIWGQ